MVFNFKKTFTLGSKAKVRSDEKETVICVHYIRSAEFDTNYIISNGKESKNVEIKQINNNDIKWNDVFTDIATTKENKLDSFHYEKSNEDISSIERINNTLENDHSESISDIKVSTETNTTKPKSILKKAPSTDTIPSENENKSVLTFISTKDYDGPSEEFVHKKKQVTQDETRTERRDTKALVALKKARVMEEKERLKKAMELEAKESEGAQEENNDVTYRTRMSMLYSSQASSIFFTEDEPEAEHVNEYEIIEAPKIEVDNFKPELYDDVNVLQSEKIEEVKENDESEVMEVKKKKMADVKKNKQSVKNIKMHEGDDESIRSNTSV